MSISLLPVRLQLLTFPKESLPFVAHAILKNVLFKKKNKFFSYTENSMEISIIADVETIEKDFPKNNSPTCPGICICEDPFRALQIDNEYGLEMSGKRINDLSAPLAQAGISIFYLSTYQTDFIFVKEKRIPLVVSVLKKSFQFIDLDLLNIEFPMYLNNNEDQFLPPENVSSWLSYDYDGNEEINKENDISKVDEETGDETIKELDEENDKVSALTIPQNYRQRNYSNETALGWSYSPTYDFSTLSLSNKLPHQEDILIEVRRQCKKSLFDKNLRLIGLNREYMEGWALIIMKIMFYPELLKTEEELENEDTGRFFSYTSTAEGISLIVEEQILELFEEHMINMSLTPRPLRCIQIDLTSFGVGTLRLDRFGIVYSMSDPLTKAGINLLYLSTFKTANVLVNESLIDQTLEVLDIYDDDKKSDNENKENETNKKVERNSSKLIDNDIKDLINNNKLKNYESINKVDIFKENNYIRDTLTRGSEDSYFYNNNRNKLLNNRNYKGHSNSVNSLNSSTVINHIGGYENLNMPYTSNPADYTNVTNTNSNKNSNANSSNRILNGNDRYLLSNNEVTATTAITTNGTITTVVNESLNNRNSNSRLGLSNIYSQNPYSVSISPTTVTAEPSSTTMNSVTVKPSQQYITNRSYYDYQYDNKIHYANPGYYKEMNNTLSNNNGNNLPSHTISYFQQYHPINTTNHISADVYTTSGFTFK
ncbi:hypothetical protein H8356DRAFT_1298867 [Neocallimastix lanati (nom. inval.)]|jgi:hypothetical protein|uniref:CASTOR ACT domain-containing protein n=1 Tax=Neocallimastix californiae TaxID=1754190 RepID=A0A1Y2ATS4_9FUNG|nr:hypothetical protein H8356DRAFT_1298867 [Neocallimastix sp. JGI-2020a]ORY25988.1 hypothetical protein LY90DRAFT_105555 [Neocallimastix californiae]|eukprot:ORY25988.1 hypothetical protein LY90DRAFT_105555 [Neocallimastix californiae]